MEHQSHAERELRPVDTTWSVAEMMARLAKALVSDGPAISLTPSLHESVSPRVALVVTTTGTQGVAKEVALSASALLASARAAHQYLGAEFGETWSLLLPLNHIAGINVLVRSLELGTFPADLRHIDGPLPKVDFTAIVPTQLYKALHGDEHLLRHLQSARAVLVGGASLSNELRSKAVSAGIKLVTTYGSSETSGGCFYNGHALTGVESRIHDGIIEIKGPTLAHSYLNPDLQLLTEDGWYRTSDRGHMEDGVLIVDGRDDDVIISGGINVSLKYVEEAASNYFDGAMCAVVGLNDDKWGQKIVLFVQGSERHIETSVVSAALGNEIVISAIHFLEEFPLKGIGKVDNVALTEIARGL